MYYLKWREKMIRTVERNEKWEITRWYGFIVSKNAKKQKYHLDFSVTCQPAVALFCDDEHMLIDYSKLYYENITNRKVINTENDIMDFIYQECYDCLGEDYTKIYVDEYEVENFSVAGRLYKFMPEQERKIEEYFSRQGRRYIDI